MNLQEHILIRFSKGEGFRGREWYIYVRQPAARGHRAFTDLSVARVWGQSYMHSLQPCQLGKWYCCQAEVQGAYAIGVVRLVSLIKASIPTMMIKSWVSCRKGLQGCTCARAAAMD